MSYPGEILNRNALRDTLRQLERAINGNAMDGDWIADLANRK